MVVSGHPATPEGFTRPEGVWVDPPAWRKVTAWARMAPTFLVIGAQRSGTTSLYRYLSMHPRIVPALRKEVHYFDFQYRKGRAWYLAHFPGPRARAGGRHRKVSGEASPYYMVHPLAPERVKAFDPDMKLIAILRNPAERAWSHYHHEVRHRVERLSFEEAIGAEEERLSDADRVMREGPDHYSHSHRHFSYLDRGRYAHYLEAWLKHFPRKNLLVLESEALFADPDSVVNTVFEFLELPSHPLSVGNAPPSPRPAMSPALRERLERHFAADQERLNALLEPG